MSNDEELSIVLKAKDEASSVVDSMSKKTQSSFADLQKKVSAGMAVAGGAITAFLGSTLEGASDAEKSDKMLEHAVVGVSKATQDQLNATRDLADELERKGVLDGDNIKQGLAQLSTFGLSNDAVRGLGKSLADLAVNQFGVNASGEQLSDTANMIAKALNGQFGVLEKSGIRFNEAQKHAIQFGTEMEKVKAINEGFAQNLKYTNDTALQTFEGSMAKTKVQLDNVKEAIGGAIMPVLTDMASKLMPIVQNLEDWIKANPELFEQIVKLVAVVGGLLTVVGGLGLILPPLIAGFTALASPVGLIMIGIVALGVAIYALIANWETVKAKAIEIWGSIKSYFDSVLDGIKNAFSTSWDSIKNAIIGKINEIKTGMTDIFNGIKQFLSDIMNAIISQIENNWNDLTTFFKGLWDVLKTVFMFGAQLIAGIVISIFNAFGIDIVAVVKQAYENIKIHIDNLVAVFKALYDSLSQIITEVAGFLSASWDSISSSVSLFLETIKGYFDSALAWIKKSWNDTWNAISSFVAPIFTAIKKVISDGWNYIKNIFTEATAPVSNAWSNLWSGLTSTVSLAWTAVENTIKASINWILEKVNTVINAINSVAQKGASAFGATAIKIPTIPLLANGGIITSPTLAMVGEGGEPEAVMPLSKLNQFAGAGAGGITVNINGGYYLSEDVARDLGEKIADILKLNRKL